MNEVITIINDAIWGYVLIGALVLCGLWFTLKTKGVQFRMIGEMFRLLGESTTKPDTDKEEAKSDKQEAKSDKEEAKSGKEEAKSDKEEAKSGKEEAKSDKEGAQSNKEEAKSGKQRHVSSFQAFAVSIATRVGTGNLAGVATAISIGGPGAVFWMWLIALIGSASAFVESTLAQLFKERCNDSYVGGPAYYIQKGLHCRWMAVLFAVLITLQFSLSNNSVQANTISGAMHEAFGWNPLVVGVVLAAVALLIVFGGIHRIAKVSSVLVPLMAIGYLILALVIIGMNIGSVPHVLKLIITNAFGIEQGVGGAMGAMIMIGVKRGLFSNEAGEGSAPNVAATATTSHPVKQGLIQALGVFTDTLLVCSCTAFIILLSGLYDVPGLEGIALTQEALKSEIGAFGPTFVAVAVLLFAFSSIIGNYYYGEANIRFITNNKTVLTVFRILSAGVVVVGGAVASAETVWNIVDLFMALLTACNLVAIVLLGKYAFRLLDDYREQKKQGKDPVFHKSTLPEIADRIEAWD